MFKIKLSIIKILLDHEHEVVKFFFFLEKQTYRIELIPQFLSHPFLLAFSPPVSQIFWSVPSPPSTRIPFWLPRSISAISQNSELFGWSSHCWAAVNRWVSRAAAGRVRRRRRSRLTPGRRTCSPASPLAATSSPPTSPRAWYVSTLKPEAFLGQFDGFLVHLMCCLRSGFDCSDVWFAQGGLPVYLCLHDTAPPGLFLGFGTGKLCCCLCTIFFDHFWVRDIAACSSCGVERQI